MWVTAEGEGSWCGRALALERRSVLLRRTISRVEAAAGWKQQQERVGGGSFWGGGQRVTGLGRGSLSEHTVWASLRSLGAGWSPRHSGTQEAAWQWYAPRPPRMAFRSVAPFKLYSKLIAACWAQWVWGL